MVRVYSGPFPVGFGPHLDMMCVFLVRAILERLCHGGRCCVFFALDLLVSSLLLTCQLIFASLVFFVFFNSKQSRSTFEAVHQFSHLFSALCYILKFDGFAQAAFSEVHCSPLFTSHTKNCRN